jgi:PAS domain S-box-containing protein
LADSGGPDYASADYLTLFFELFRRTSDAVYLMRLTDGVAVDANESFLRLTGYDRAEVVGHSMLGTSVWASPEGWRGFMEELWERGRVNDRRVRVRNRSGHEFSMRLSAVVARWRGQDIAMGIGTDI